MRRVAFVSFHTSPLDVPGSGDSGGMNVYVRNLARHLGRTGLPCDIFTRRADPRSPDVVWTDPGVRVVHVDSGLRGPVSKDALPRHLDDFTAELLVRIDEGGHDVLHSHYWMSGLAALTVGDKLGVPVVHTAHTLALLRALPDGGEARVEAERHVARAADLLVASTDQEADALVAAYGAGSLQTSVIPPGVDHERFEPAARSRGSWLRDELGVADDEHLVVCVGRIQRLKGTDLAVEAIRVLGRRARDLASRVTLAVVGGASGDDGEATLRELRSVAARSDTVSRIVFVPPRPHGEIADVYHGADLCLVPSRSETFGLVALEAQACGVPVVAAAVNGLGDLVVSERSGILVDRPDAGLFAAAIERTLSDRRLRRRLGQGAREMAAGYSWGLAAAQHRMEYGDLLASGDMAACS